jgi:TolB-like protein
MWTTPLLLALALLVEPAAPPQASPASSPSPPAARPARHKLAVLGFHALEVERGVAELLSEVALTDASRFKGLEVMGESDVGAMLGHERQQQLLGCKEDSACMAQLGGAMGADFLLVGSVGRLGSSTRIDLKLLDVRQGKVLARSGETIEGQQDRAITAVQRAVVKLLTPVAGRPAPAAGGDAGDLNRSVRVRVRPGAEALVKGHKSWGKGCIPGPIPEIRITRPPTRGTVELRRGDFAVDGAWGTGADLSCMGRVFPGLGIYYRAAGPAPALDTMHYQLTTGIQRPVTYEVEVEISIVP